MNWPSGSIHFIFDSPVGTLYLVACQEGLCALLWLDGPEEQSLKESILRLPVSKDHPIIRRTLSQLKEYFSGERKIFDIPLVTEGTEFQKQAWDILKQIPYGQTISYHDQACRLGDPKKARAVGSANGKNRHCIIVPCHRVVARSGDLGGFSGGLDKKKRLLELENDTQLSFLI